MTLENLMRDTCYWQRLLRLGSYEPGKIDGIRGPKTRQAEERWHKDADAVLAAYGRYDARSEGVLMTLLPAAQRVARLWLSLAVPAGKSAGVDVRLICGTRSYAEQDVLYRKRPRVTNARAGQSMHNFGLAFDFGLFREGDYLEKSAQYNVLGRLSKQIPNVTWGGDWKKLVDTPHIQLDLFGETAAVRRVFESD